MVKEETNKARSRGGHVVVMHDGSHFYDDLFAAKQKSSFFLAARPSS